MIRLLMLDADAQLISAVRRGLEASQIEVFAERSVAGARRRADTEQFDAALLDCDLLHEDELRAFAGLPLILATSCLEPVGGHRFFARGVLLGKPFTSAQLLAALHRTCAGLRGPLEGLLDVLRRAHTAGESCTLQVEAALLVVEHGEVVHAECGTQRGERALTEVLSLVRPTITRLPARPSVRTIQRPFRALMLELLQRIEEREQEETPL
jgi:DNA-binding response OmpR family regulator